MLSWAISLSSRCARLARTVSCPRPPRRLRHSPSAPNVSGASRGSSSLSSPAVDPSPSRSSRTRSYAPVGDAHERADRAGAADGSHHLGLQTLNRGVGGVGRDLNGRLGGVGARHLALQAAHAVAERGQVQPPPRPLGLQSRLVGVLFFLVERAGQPGRRGVAQVVAAAAETAGPLAVDLRAFPDPALQREPRRDVAPGIVVLEIERAGAGHAVAGPGAGGGDLDGLRLHRVARAGARHPAIAQMDIVTEENAEGAMPLIPTERRAPRPADRPPLPVADRLTERVHTGSQVPGTAERPRVAQFIAELFLVGERSQGETRDPWSSRCRRGTRGARCARRTRS